MSGARADGRPLGGAPGAPLGAALLVAGAACAFGAISTLTVLAAAGGAGPPLAAVLFWRYAIAGLVLSALPAGRAGPPGRRVPIRWRALLLGGGGQAAVAYLSLSAVRWIPVATLAFLFYTFPAWVVLFAALRGSERLDRTKLGALALSLAGIACTVGLPGGRAPAAGPAWPGVLLALLAAVVYALYIPYLGRLQERETPAGASVLVCLGATVIFGVLTPLTRTSTFVAPWHYPAASWAAIAVLAVVCTVLAFIAFMRGLGTLGPVRTAIVSTVEPFFTAVLGAVVLGQPFGAATFVGGALIAAAVLLLQRPARGPAAAPQVA